MKSTQNKKLLTQKLPGFSLVILTLLFALGFSACQKENIEPELADRYMKVRMTDAPGAFVELNVEVDKVEAYNESKGWVTLEERSYTYDVTKLSNGTEVVIAAATNLSAGSYTEIRLTYGAGSSVKMEVEPGTYITHSMTAQTQTVIPVQVDLENETGASLLIDFHAAASVVENAGNYFLDPVVTWISDTKTGVRGQVESEPQAAVMLMAKGGSGEIVFSTYTDAQGYFLMRGMEAGTYDMLVQFKDAAGEMREATFEDVVIVKGEIHEMGSLSIR